MDKPVLHLRMPQRARSLCGVRLSAAQRSATAVGLDEHNAIQLTSEDSDQPACRACLVALLAAALRRYGVRFVSDSAPSEPEPELVRLWTGALLRQRREAAGFTRADVACLSGLAESTIRNAETGRHKVSRRVLRRLAAIPDLDPSRAK